MSLGFAGVDNAVAASTRIPWRVWTAYGALLFGFGFLLTANLDQQELWTDEAETAILAESILDRGVPSLEEDGSTHYPFQLGYLNASNVWVGTPWLDEYLTAASFWLFGVEVWAGRLPFALMMLASSAVLMRVLWLAHRDHLRAWVGGFLLLTSPGIVLFARHIRYYPLLVFAEALLLLGLCYGSLRRPVLGTALLTVGLTIPLYSNYLPVPANVLGLAVVGVVFTRRGEPLLRMIVTSIGLAALLAGPWVLYARGQMFGSYVDASVYFGGGVATDLDGWHSRLDRLAFYAWTYAGWCPLLLLSLPVIRIARCVWVGLPVPISPVALFCWCVFPASLVILSILPLAMPRYIVAFLPALFLLVTDALFDDVRRGWLRWLLVFLIGFTCVLQHPLSPSRWWAGGLPIAILQSLPGEQTTRTEAIAALLNERSDASERVLVMSDELPLQFRLQSKLVCAQRLPQVQGVLPEWIIPQQLGETVDEVCGLLPPGWAEAYEAIPLTVDVEDPAVSAADRSVRGTVVYRRRNTTRENVGLNVDWAREGYPIHRLVAIRGEAVARLAIVEGDPRATRVVIYDPGLGRRAEGLRLRRGATSAEIRYGGGFRLEAGGRYAIRFRCRADKPRTMEVCVVAQEPPIRESEFRAACDVGAQWEWHRIEFEAEWSTDRAAIDFLLGGDEVSVEIGDAEIIGVGEE